MDTYEHKQTGRSVFTVMVCVAMVILCVLFWLAAHWIPRVIAIVLIAASVSAMYAFVRDEEWSLRIDDHSLEWHYPRWPKSTGSVNLSEVRKITVNEHTGKLEMILKNEETKRIKFFGSANKIYKYLRIHQSDIECCLEKSI
jgi:uncharacterized membrane protein YdbT with pleckstrin-like domain